MTPVPLMHPDAATAVREVCGFALVGVALLAQLFAVAILVDVRRATGSWRPRFDRFDWTIGATFGVSFSALVGTVGLLTAAGSGPLPWWGVALVAVAVPPPLFAFRAWANEGGVARLVNGKNGHVS